ncbi:MAG: septum site-determining protein MinC [Anaerolineae bacterium]|nr:septum site-determining protein MinC [Thermoflexales bacterium]MDW8394855.1 septum site-determining protein MinC [Anaerolineae bacterium]
MVTIKGSRSGVVIVFNGSPSDSLAAKLGELEARLVASPGFFRGSEVVVDVRDAALEAEDLKRIVALLETYDVRVGGVLAQNERTLQNALSLDVALQPAKGRKSLKRAEEETPAREEGLSVEETLFVERRIRSGQVLRHPGNIVVRGDVSPGAQIIAGGSIVVWGRLRGDVHAGALGNRAAVVCALELSPVLLKIADVVSWHHRNASTSTGKPRRWLRELFSSASSVSPATAEPSIARLVNGEIVVTVWHCR